jgi:hypothetical protein
VVSVTGHTVTVVYVISVVVQSSGGTDEEPESTLVGTTGVVSGTVGVSVGAGVSEGSVSVSVSAGGGGTCEVCSGGGGTSEVSSGPPGAVEVEVTGHQVVDTMMVEVVTVVESAGQLVTVGAH